MQLNLQLTYRAAELDIMKQYALFVKVKSIYRHSIIYNYTPSKLAKITGLHRKTVDRYVKKLIANGFCEMRNGHLLFKKPKKIIGKSKSVQIIIKKNYSQERILDIIYLSLIKDNKRQQAFNIAVEFGSKSITRAMKFLRNYEINLNEKNLIKKIMVSKGSEKKNRLANRPIFTVKSLANLFSVSVPTSRATIQRLKNYHRIKTRNEYKFLGKFLADRNFALFLSYNPGKYSIRNRKLYRLIGFSISLM